MRSASLAALFLLASVLPASAEDGKEGQHLESQTDIGFVVGIGDGPFGHRVLTRTFFNIDDRENAFEAHYGLAWEPFKHVTFDATAGYLVSDDGPDTRHSFVAGGWAEGAWHHRRLMVKAEGLKRFGEDSRYEGHYSLDYAVVGVHLSHLDDAASAGFQFGSGHGLLPFRVDIRISFGITDGAPDHASRFVLSLDFR